MLGADLRRTEDGTLLPVRVVPRSSRTAVDGTHDGAVRIRLKSPPVDGAANKELCNFISKTLGVPKGSVEIVSGERGRSKTVMVRGVTPEEVRDRLLPTGSV